MLHLLSLRYMTSEAGAAPFVAAHVKFPERHHREGTFVLSGQTVPADVGGAILARWVDRAAVEQIASEDPFVKAGGGECSITTVEPGRVHPALAEVLEADAFALAVDRAVHAAGRIRRIGAVNCVLG
jgi:uncharacterized protein YciI